MNFTKQRATSSDAQEIRQRFGISLSAGDAFVINSERDCVLHFYYRDRFDMGGTTNEYWTFAYRGKTYTVGRNTIPKGPDYGPDEYNILITSVEEDKSRRQVSRVDQDFIDTFAQAFSIYKKYRDIETNIESASAGNIYHFSFKGEQE